MFGRNKGYTTPLLDVDQLDAICQRLADVDEAWLGFDCRAAFDVISDRWWSAEQGRYINYRIHFPGWLWKKIRNQLSDEATLIHLLGARDV